MSKKRNNRPDTPHQKSKREELQEQLANLYKSEQGKKLIGIPLTQMELAEKLHMTQPDISRTLRGHEIDWNTGEIIPKASRIDLIQLSKNTTITRPSIFFISVPRNKRKRLKAALLLYFPSTETQYGIIHIIENTQPSGLLIFSDDHNLEHNLASNSYLQEIMDKLNIDNNNQ